jgi:hypothetical protein
MEKEAAYGGMETLAYLDICTGTALMFHIL